MQLQYWGTRSSAMSPVQTPYVISVGVGSFPKMSIKLNASSPVANVGASLRGTVVCINTDVMDVVKMTTALKMMKRNEWFTSQVA